MKGYVDNIEKLALANDNFRKVLIVNGRAEPMKLYTLYMPPHHRDGVVHKTKAEAEADTEHWQGETTE
ncbi:MAG: hypothetical protein AAB500_02165 [Patescibacteria group bacterium]